jgi:proteasome lid subunit RPN8/RPN11
MSMIFLPDRQPFGAAIDAAIMVHANANPRTEICGVVTAAAGGTGWVYHRLANVAADPATIFLIDPSDLSALPPPAAIIHSHPHGPAWPSAHDMQQAMAGACVWGIALPTWLHQKAPDMPGAGEVFWFGDAVMPSLDRRGYRHGVSDCYALVRDWYRLHHSITLIDRPREWNWWQEGGDLFDAHFALSGFERHPAEITPQAGDVALANILSPMVNHALIYLGDGLVLHHPAGRAGYEPGRLPRREPLARWQRYLRCWARHPKMAERNNSGDADQ